MLEPYIIAECFIDTAMVRFIRNGNYPIHAEGNTGVAKMMSDKPHVFGVGVVDNDKRFAPYLKGFKEIKKGNGLSLRKHPTNNQYLIVVGEKDAEEWLQSQIHACGKTLTDFNFHNFYHFEQTTKKSEKDSKVLSLLNALKQKPAPGFVTMNKWIEDILNTQDSKKPTKKRRGR